MVISAVQRRPVSWPVFRPRLRLRYQGPILTVLLLFSGLPARAQLPAAEVTSLEKHDKKFQSLSFQWKVVHQQVTHPASTDRINTYVERAKNDGLQFAAAHHIHDPVVKAEIIQGNQEAARKSGSGLKLQYQSLFHLDRDQEKTGAWADITEKQPGYALTTTFHQWYGPDWAVLYAGFAKGTHGERVIPMGPYVWGSPGDATLFRAPFVNCLDITPEEFVFLVGKNPMKLFGAKWQVVDTNAAGWTIQTQVTQGMNSPFTLQVKLDKRHGGLPSEMVMQMHTFSDVYRVQKWKQNNGEWMPDEVTLMGNWGPVVRQRTWKLKSVQAGKNIAITIPIGRTNMMDSRLVGDRLGYPDIVVADKHNDPNIVRYQWTGKLPTLDELRGLKAKYLADNPPPRSSRGWLLLPGILLIVIGGIWYLRIRKLSRRPRPVPTSEPKL